MDRIDNEIIVFETIDSTNDQLKRYLIENSNYKIVIAKEQTKGRGQKDNKFISPPGGLYISIAIKPKYDIEKLKYLSIRTALEIKNILDKLYNKNIKLKWLNDIILDEKKLGGILIENIFSKDNKLEYSVIGIGLNLLNNIKLNEELNDNYISLSLTNYENESKKIINEIIPSIKSLENDFSISNITNNYNECLYLKNTNITLVSNKETYFGKLLSINEDLSLNLLLNENIKSFSYNLYKIKDPYKK
ncbi:biotin--[acetyl-CoA-carboxylase] ligase [Helcococcus ovis]|uniref:biotin--[acetyl-CoA-carboxylase] ligase n=2 Tax=Peptoniphilaceae TaxID=1570339 RepID=UPI00106F3228|nr:biotin--[acetyl-CoA-carboxylase] ligase [Helcococcus ovis]TFF65980.1 biotin--[acetyl-CoA-carboxylase] ligase [Helcococcus ovis]WNZ01252.1 biotin--[acetyl-CoA-carboxylase] ligase [Helcococcus ovis]